MSPLLRSTLFVGASLAMHAALLVAPLSSNNRSTSTATRERRLALHPLAAARPTAPAQAVPRPQTPALLPEAVGSAASEPTSAAVLEQAPRSAKGDDGGVATAEPRGAHEAAVVAGARAEAQAAADEQLCWRSVGLLLQRRATEQLPPAVRRRGLTGEVVLRFRLDAQGRATEIRVEQRRGAALLEEAAQQLLAEPFALRCAGEGRWSVDFVPPS